MDIISDKLVFLSNQLHRLSNRSHISTETQQKFSSTKSKIWMNQR